MGLYKRGRTWHMCFCYNGTQVRRSTKTRDRKLAEKIYSKTLTQVAEKKWFDKLEGEKITFKGMMERYMREHSIPKKASTSRDDCCLMHLLPFFGDFTLTEITPKLINEYKTERINQNAASGTINKELALAKHAYNLSIKEWEWVKDNPFKNVSREKEPPLRDRWLRYDEEERLLSVSPKWLIELIVFAVETGCRQGEILSLTWDDVNLFNKTATIFGSKTGDRRTIPLSERAYELLRDKSKVRALKTNFVFTYPKTDRIIGQTLRYAFHSAKRKAKIESFRFHDLRHTFATRLAQSGVDPYTIQKLLGHKTASMTQRYSHHCVDSLRRGIDILERAKAEEKSKKLSQI